MYSNKSLDHILKSTNTLLPTARKTGTTISGLKFKDGVILAADTRSTEDTIVADKNTTKIHYISKNMRCCGAGTAADTDYVTRMIKSDLALYTLETNDDRPPVRMAKEILSHYLFQYQGHVGAYLIIGGYDKEGPQLFTIAAHGSVDALPYTTMGSGSLAAMAILESRYKHGMELEEAKKLARDSIAAGIFNDLGSGSNIDLCIFTKDKTEYLRNYEISNKKGVKQGNYKYPPGSTAVLSTTKIPIEIVSTTIVQVEEPMEM